jgi:hypothetical protein
VQYADDAQVWLNSWSEVPDFSAAMAVFQRASGQALNVVKTLLLPLGAAARRRLWRWALVGVAEQPPPELGVVLRAAAGSSAPRVRGLVPPGCNILGMPVVAEAKVLGVQLTAEGVAGADWAAKVPAVLAAFGRLSAMGLSVFGRGWGATSYGLSLLLYHAELAGSPPAGVVGALQAALAKLVDRGRGPDAPQGFAGVKGELLVGTPREGGFGVLPLRQHILARSAAGCSRWAKSLFGLQWRAPEAGGRSLPAPAAGASPAPPYAAALATLWRVGSFSVADFVNDFVLGAGGHQRAAAHAPPLGPDGGPVREPLLRLARGFQELPEMADVPYVRHAPGRRQVSFPLGTWTAHAPLFHNAQALSRQAGEPLRASNLHVQ